MLYLASTQGAEATTAEHTAEAAQYLTFTAPDAHLLTFIFWTWVMMAIVIVVAFLARGGVGTIPRGWAGAFEHIYDWIADLSFSMMGKEGMRYIPFAMTIFLFVLASNWIALLPLPVIHFGEHAGAYDFKMHVSGPPVIGGREFHELALEAPSGNQNTTMALALISFVAFTFYGLRKHYERARFGGGHGHAHDGHAPDESHRDPHDTAHAHPVTDPVTAIVKGFFTWLAHFIEPTPTLWRSLDGPLRYMLVPLLCILFVFLNIIEEFARIISLTIRLFGNIFGEHQVKMGLFLAMGSFAGMAVGGIQAAAAGAVLGGGLLSVLLWGSSVFVTLIGTLAGFIQAFIFFVLTLSYIAHAVADEH